MGKEKIHVLLIEDSSGDYELTRALLSEMEGYEVALDWAATFDDGKRQIRHGGHHVILLDYMLGLHNGLDLLKNTSQSCAAPIIFLSGQENYQVDLAAAKAGAADYLIKNHLNTAILERSIRYAMQHKRVESAWRNALQENNRLATAITSLPVGVIITDHLQTDNPIIFVNPAFTQITGYSMIAVTGRNCRFLQGAQTDQNAIDAMRKAIVAGRPFQERILNYRKDGRPFWNDLRLQPLFNEGRLVSYAGLMHDVTSRVEAEESNRDLVVNLGERVKELSALHAVARTLQEEQISTEVLLEKLVEQILPAFQFPEAMAACLNVADQQYCTPLFEDSEYSLSSRSHLSDGRVVALKAVYQKGREADGVLFLEEEHSLVRSIVEMVCSRCERDLARGQLQQAHSQLEERVARRTLQLELRTNELRTSEERLRRINGEILELSQLKFSPQATVAEILGVFNEAAVRFIDIERSSAWMYNETRESVHCLDFFDKRTGQHGGGAGVLVSELPEAFSALQEARVLPIDDAAHDGRIPHFQRQFLEPFGIASNLLAPIFRSGVIVGILSLARIDKARPWSLEDQTYAGSLADLIALKMETLELRKTEESLRLATLEAETARKSAENANSAKSEFLSRMSHELRTPLNSILGFGQLLQRDALSGKQQERIELVVTAGHHLLALINEVLDIASVESGRLVLFIEPVQLDSAVREALSLVAPLAARSHISLIDETKNGAMQNGEMQNGDNLFAAADRQKLHQVILNLLSNAVKYNRPEGQVRVFCSRAPDNRVQLGVANSGRGLSERDLERVFLPFERLGAGQSGIEGTGLGLPLALRLVEAMHGTLEARSTPEEETIFLVTLPASRALSLPPRAVLEETRQLQSEENFRVLYIEDNFTNLKLVENIFHEVKNVHLMSSVQGRLGLDLAREHQPDLILLDLHLPDIGGEEVLRHLKSQARTRDIPVIIVTADATTARLRQLREQGAYECLTKPLDISLFLSVVSKVMHEKNS